MTSKEVLRKIESDANDVLITLEKCIVDAVLYDLPELFAPLRASHAAVQQLYNTCDQATVKPK